MDAIAEFERRLPQGLRELVMTYFEFFFNLEREKTLRGYTRPLDLSRFEDASWMWEEEGIKKISQRLYSLKPIALISEESATHLQVVDERSFQAGTYGTDFSWSYGARE